MTMCSWLFHPLSLFQRAVAGHVAFYPHTSKALFWRAMKVKMEMWFLYRWKIFLLNFFVWLWFAKHVNSGMYERWKEESSQSTVYSFPEWRTRSCKNIHVLGRYARHRDVVRGKVPSERVGFIKFISLYRSYQGYPCVFLHIWSMSYLTRSMSNVNLISANCCLIIYQNVQIQSHFSSVNQLLMHHLHFILTPVWISILRPKFRHWDNICALSDASVIVFDSHENWMQEKCEGGEKR